MSEKRYAVIIDHAWDEDDTLVYFSNIQALNDWISRNAQSYNPKDFTPIEYVELRVRTRTEVVID